MDDFIQRYTKALVGGSSSGADVGLSPDEEDAILELARIVAHGTERKNAPLATFISGLFAGAQGLDAADRPGAISRALDAARALLDETAGENERNAPL